MKQLATVLTLCALFFGTSKHACAQPDIKKLLNAVLPSIVALEVTTDGGAHFGQSGSGFFIDSIHVLTCRHLLDNADFIAVHCEGENAVVVDGVVADDFLSDLAVLVVHMPHKITPLRLSRALPERGDNVFMVGSPRGYEFSVARGMVAGLRTVTTGIPSIQLSVPASKGSSGSPVFNDAGEVIGIMSEIAEGQDIVFAVPALQLDALHYYPMLSLFEWRQTALRYADMDAEPDVSRTATKPFPSNPLKIDAMVLAGAHRADSMFARKSWKDALTLYTKLAAAVPSYAQFWQRAGECALRTKDKEHGVIMLENAAKVDKKKPEVIVANAALYSELGMNKEAMNALTQYVELRPNDPVGWMNMASAWHDMGRDSSALEVIDQAIALAPQQPLAHVMKAECLHTLHRNADAEHECLTALKIDPQCVEAMSKIAVIYAETDQNAKAAEAFERLLKKLPASSAYWAGYGSVLLLLKRYGDAAAAFETSIKLKPDVADVHAALSSAYTGLGKQEELERELHIAIQLNPKIAFPHYALARELYAKHHDKAAALEEYNILLTLDATLAKRLYDFLYK